MAYLTIFCRKFPKKSQRSGREWGGQAGWAKFPTFTENLFCKLPLLTYSKARECRYNGGQMLSKIIFNLRGILAYIQNASEKGYALVYQNRSK